MVHDWNKCSILLLQRLKNKDYSHFPNHRKEEKSWLSRRKNLLPFFFNFSYLIFFLFACEKGEGAGWLLIYNCHICNLCLYACFAVPPRVSNEFMNFTIAFNSTFTKECYLRGDPQISVNWTKDGVLLSKNNTLIIRQATLKDKGYYECTAKNDYGKANSSFWIDVTGKL